MHRTAMLRDPRTLGLGIALALVTAAMAFEPLTGIDVHVHSFPPLHGDWAPRVGPGTWAAVLIGVLAIRHAGTFALVAPWRRLLTASFVASLAWMLALAFVDGSDGIGVVLDGDLEYLQTARATTDLPATLATYVSRIPHDAPLGNWPSHVAGHPAGALSFFVLLVRVGLGSGFAAGMVVVLIASTTAAAVLVTLRRLDAEGLARVAAPFLVFGPAAIWQAVSADAMFAAVGAWGIAALAIAATSQRWWLPWSLLAGLLLGYLVMLSYGLPLFGLLALTVLYLSRSWRPLVPAVLAAVGVVLAFAYFGFYWWEAIVVLRSRYWAGIARLRPAYYWVLANLALLVLSAGPLVGAVVAQAIARLKQRTDGATRVVAWVTCAGIAMVLIANLSLMSKAEVERIWLPFVPWLLVGTALLSPAWRRWGLALQVVAALLVQHLFFTTW